MGDAQEKTEKKEVVARNGGHECAATYQGPCNSVSKMLFLAVEMKLRMVMQFA